MACPHTSLSLSWPDRCFSGRFEHAQNAPCPLCPAEAADRALRAKVSSLLSSLAANDAFCGILAAELKKWGIV